MANLPQIRLNIGTHEITLRPCTDEGRAMESLAIISTWHEIALIHHWTLRKLQQWADHAENDNDYHAAEAAFIHLATGYPARPHPH